MLTRLSHSDPTKVATQEFTPFFYWSLIRSQKKILSSGGARGEARGAWPPLFLVQKKFFLRPGPPAYLRGLDDRPPPPLLSEGLDPPLLREKLQIIDMRKHTTAAHSWFDTYCTNVQDMYVAVSPKVLLLSFFFSVSLPKPIEFELRRWRTPESSVS